MEAIEIKETDNQQNIDDKELEKKAIEEIWKDIAIKKIRAEKVGPSGWLDCPLKKTNKRFLRNTMKATISYNNRTHNNGKPTEEVGGKTLSRSLKGKHRDDKGGNVSYKYSKDIR